jgi:hypothetical protein
MKVRLTTLQIAHLIVSIMLLVVEILILANHYGLI